MKVDVTDITISDLEKIIRIQKNLADSTKLSMKFKDNEPISEREENNSLYELL